MFDYWKENFYSPQCLMFFRYDIRSHSQMEEIRKMTGICPQHDVLFDELTAKEHLSFFARIRVRLTAAKKYE